MAKCECIRVLLSVCLFFPLAGMPSRNVFPRLPAADLH